MTVWRIGAVVLAMSCRGTSDPLRGSRPRPPIAPPAPTSPAPRDQVVVDPAGFPQDAPDSAARASAPAAPIDPVDEARAIDEIAFENDYLRQKERLFADHAGKWIAIVAGRLLPPGARGGVAPVATFEECLAAADLVDAKALHRFVFRIGEEGDVLYAESAGAPRSVAGAALRGALGITALFDVKSGELRWKRGEKEKRFRLENGCIELALSDPSGANSMGARVADSAGFGGFLALEATVAELLDLPRFEIPGRVLLQTASGVRELRRSRLRVKVPDLDVDALVPAATWPE